MYAMCDSLGLPDHSKGLSYDEITEMWIKIIEEKEDYAIDRFDKTFR